jgi:hypothetical protein
VDSKVAGGGIRHLQKHSHMLAISRMREEEWKINVETLSGENLCIEETNCIRKRETTLHQYL